MSNQAKATAIRVALKNLIDGLAAKTTSESFLKVALQDAIKEALQGTKGADRLKNILKENVKIYDGFDEVQRSTIETLADEIEDSDDPELEFIFKVDKLNEELGL